MGKIVRVTWERIEVLKSEDYGVFGEPGNSAEWNVWFNVSIDGKKKTGHFWERDEVRDNRTYDVDHWLDVALDGELAIDVWGFESDSTSALDMLPKFKRTHSPEPGWETPGGTSYRKALSKKSFRYEVHYNIKYISEGATLTPGHGTLFDVRYSGLWDASSKRTFCSLGRSAAQVNAQAAEIWQEGGRLAQLQPYVMGNKVLYNVIWTFSGIRQLWNIDCDEAHFSKTTGETWSWGRPHQVIPFVVNGQVRSACLWNEGTHGQRWHPNTDEAGFRAITGETWSWARPHQVYAFVVNGQVRYSCLWNAGQHSQVWHPNCSEAEAIKLGQDNWSWGRAHQIQPFVHNKQRRYSVLWNAGQQGQLWNVNCDRQQASVNTVDTSSWGRPRQIFTVP